MIEWLNELIMSLARRLEHNQFVSPVLRAHLEDELSKLLKMRARYREQREEEQKEVDHCK